MSFTTINDKPTAALRNRAEWYAHDGKQGGRLAAIASGEEDTADDMDTKELTRNADDSSNHEERK